MPKRVAILQSNYIPWKGYFDIIHDVDEFIFLDDVQFTRQDWRNRNRIKTPTGWAWLTIPVGTSLKRRVCDVVLPSGSWARDHWRRIEASYSAAPYFHTYRTLFADVFLRAGRQSLSDFNQHFIRTIAQEIGILTRFRDSRELVAGGRSGDRLLEILGQTGADVYVSGPAAQSYIDPASFTAAGIELVWKDYAGYPEYSQVFPPFRHDVTILDLLFHTGPQAARYIWGWRDDPR